MLMHSHMKAILIISGAYLAFTEPHMQLIPFPVKQTAVVSFAFFFPSSFFFFTEIKCLSLGDSLF